MKAKPTYNPLYALVYEITNVLVTSNNRWLDYRLIRLARLHCFDDWVEYKAASAMITIDEQVKRLNQQIEWKEYQKDQYIFTEDSEGETLLGGEMRVTAPWEKFKID